MSAATTESRTRPEAGPLAEELLVLAGVCAIGWVVQLVAIDITPWQALVGMAALYAICVAGLLLARYAPFYLPSVAWISLIGIVLTLPFVPGSAAVVAMVEPIDFLALTVPCLAYAGIAISRQEIHVVKRSGWKLLVVAVFVLVGTYLGSVVIADVTLRLTGA